MAMKTNRPGERRLR